MINFIAKKQQLLKDVELIKSIVSGMDNYFILGVKQLKIYANLKTSTILLINKENRNNCELKVMYYHGDEVAEFTDLFKKTRIFINKSEWTEDKISDILEQLSK